MKRISPLPHLDRMGLCMLAFYLLVGLMTGCESTTQSDLARPSSTWDGMLSKADQILSSGLADPDPRIRASTIEVVASTRQQRLAPTLLRLIRDPVVPVRFAAILAIGDLRYSSAKSDIQQVFDETKEDLNVRVAAAYAMFRLGSAPYIDFPRKAITSGNQTVRANAALILGKTGDTQVLDDLYWALQDKDSDEQVLVQAAESIALLGDGRIYQRLWGKLISAYADDRMAGIRAMGALKTEQARNAIITMLEDGVVEVRLTAAEQLGKLHNASGQMKVLEILGKDLSSLSGLETGEPSRVKVLAALAIGEIGSEPLLKYLPRLLDDKSRLVQVAAAKAVFLQKGFINK
jgi:HEAT repeat protein